MSDDKKLIFIAIIMGFLFASLIGGLCGCTAIRHALGHEQTELQADEYPPELAGVWQPAKLSAWRWFEKRYGAYLRKQGRMPVCRPVMCRMAEKTIWIDGVEAGAWTVGPQLFYFWRGQRNPLGSVEHELRHCFVLQNGLPNSEEAVK